MSKLIDTTGNVIKEGEDDYIADLCDKLHDDIYSVNEEDEIRFGNDLYLEWIGNLKIVYDE